MSTPQNPPKKPSGHFFMGGEKYVCVVMRIRDRRLDTNIPFNLDMLIDSDTVEFSRGDEFMTAWVLERMLKEQPDVTQ